MGCLEAPDCCADAPVVPVPAGDTLTAEARLADLFAGYGDVPMPTVDTTGAAAWVAATLAAMTTAEKIGQGFIAHLPGRMRAARAMVAEQHVGGFLMPRLLPPREVRETAEQLQETATTPLFLAADYEGGVGRFSNALTDLPANMAMGASGDPVLAAAAGRLTALESRAIGVNLLFAPVVDVNNNPANPIINVRAFGETPELVTRLARPWVREAEALGVLATLKHFPGHGDTHLDTHSDLATLEGSRPALWQTELAPYRDLLRGTDPPGAVMAAHLLVPAFDPDPLPASLSPRVIGGLLRDTLGYDGLVITDDIRMGALQRDFSFSERILRAFEADVDIVLTPSDLPRAVGVVQEALRTGRLAEAALDRRTRRILRAKARLGLHRAPLADEALLDALLTHARGTPIAQALADASLTVLQTHPALPLADTARVALVQLSNYRNSETIAAAMDRFAEALDLPTRSQARFDGEPTRRQQQRTLTDAGNAEVVVLTLYLRLRSGRGEAGLFPAQQQLVEELLAQEVPVVLVTFGNPYVATPFRQAAALVVAYDQSEATAAAAARVLRGRQPAPGRLPITVDPFPFGAGAE